MKLPNGANYYGEVKNGKPSGKGTMIWSKNKSYSGEWIEGKRSGYGKYISVEKDYNYSTEGDPTLIIYAGEWKNDMFNGHGVYRRQVFAPVVYGFQYKEQNGFFANHKFIKGYEKEEFPYSMYLKYNDGLTRISLDINKETWQEEWDNTLEQLISNKYITVSINRNQTREEYDSDSISWTKDKAKVIKALTPYYTTFNKMLSSYLTDQGDKFIFNEEYSIN
ncbi:hypothetical protein ['Paenibacillus yunnanensis' Narsing Rao et al. 2020]|uniref:hypothetical protein n=1 Tax=Paenibacillus tengchongensis TaxID=2608684 RepID=UPI001651D06E|nr:hypothetical protein [Paenibacillus tengchongensis]